MPLASLPKLKPSSATWASGDLGGSLPKKERSASSKLGSLPKSPLDWVMKYARLSVVQLRADNDAHHSFVPPLGVGKVATDGSTDYMHGSARAASTREHGPHVWRACCSHHAQARRAHYLLRAVPTHQVLLGAAGDLARKKTFPSLFKLYLGRYLPQCAHAPPNQCPLAPFRSAVATPAQQTPLLLAGNLRPPARFVFDLPPVSR